MRGQFVPHFLSFLLIVSSILVLLLLLLRQGMRMSVQEAVCFACWCRWSLGNLYPRTTGLMNDGQLSAEDPFKLQNRRGSGRRGMCAVAVCRPNEWDGDDAARPVVAGRRSKYVAPNRQYLHRRRRLPPSATTSRDSDGTHVLLFTLTTGK